MHYESNYEYSGPEKVHSQIQQRIGSICGGTGWVNFILNENSIFCRKPSVIVKLNRVQDNDNLELSEWNQEICISRKPDIGVPSSIMFQTSFIMSACSQIKNYQVQTTHPINHQPTHPPGEIK